MNYKAFTLKVALNFLIFLDYDRQTGSPVVRIHAYWIGDKGFRHISHERMLFENTASARNYISDFSKESAENWCDENLPSDEK